MVGGGGGKTRTLNNRTNKQRQLQWQHNRATALRSPAQCYLWPTDGLQKEFDLDMKMGGRVPGVSRGHWLPGTSRTHKAKGKKGGRKKATGTGEKKERSKPEHQCCARVWGSGSGFDQCSFAAKEGDFCTKHAKQAEITCEPCQVDDDGKKVGLVCGRIDQFQDGEDGVPPYKDASGVIRIEWTSSEMKARVEEEMEAGASKELQGAKKKTGGRKKKGATKSPSTVEVQSAEDLAAAIGDVSPTKSDEIVNALDEEDVDDEGSVDAAFKAADTNGDGVIDAQEFAAMQQGKANQFQKSPAAVPMNWARDGRARWGLWGSGDDEGGRGGRRNLRRDPETNAITTGDGDVIGVEDDEEGAQIRWRRMMRMMRRMMSDSDWVD